MFSPSVETSERQRRYTCMLNLIFKVNSRGRGARPSQTAGSSVIGERSNVNIKETGEIQPPCERMTGGRGRGRRADGLESRGGRHRYQGHASLLGERARAGGRRVRLEAKVSGRPLSPSLPRPTPMPNRRSFVLPWLPSSLLLLATMPSNKATTSRRPRCQLARPHNHSVCTYL